MDRPPFLLVSDLHFHKWGAFSTINKNGVNSRLQIILDALEEGIDQLIMSGGGTVVVAGDLFHTRGTLTPSVLNPVLDLFQRNARAGIKIHMIPGNHDLESNDSKRLTSSCTALERFGSIYADKPGVIEDLGLVMIPWQPSLDLLREELSKHRGVARAAVIHAPLNGVIEGLPDKGLSTHELQEYGFEAVFVGHYHNHIVTSLAGSPNVVCSIGALTHQTWGDVKSRAGYMLVNPTDFSFVHHETSAPRFVDFDLDWTEAQIGPNVEGCYVRVKLGEATESEERELREHLREAGALGVNVFRQPVVVAPERASGGIKSGASIEASIEDWIKLSKPAVDPAKLYDRCVRVLGQVEAE